MKFYNKFYILILFVCVFLFWKFFFQGLIPLPADTIVGMYHPWRDFYAKDYPNGIAFNNPLITDPVRQQFIWKKLAIDDYRSGQWPVNNPYSFSGYPLLANFQSGAFYPLNILFFLLPFNFAWGAYIFLQFFLGALFMFWFLRQEHGATVAFFGSIVWILSGFWISWSEWGNILHTALWLPLILLSIDKMTGDKLQGRSRMIWTLIYLFSLVFSFFAGHLQTFFYLYVFSFFYFFYRLRHKKNKTQMILLFMFLTFSFSLLSLPQWYPTLQFILVSARSNDIQNVLTRDDWFIPWQHLIQLVIPDYFGNPAKGNYWGIWNYGEYLSYIGIIPVFLALLGIIKSITKRKNMFFIGALFIVWLFAIKNPISEIPYRLQIPFFQTAQPSRLIFLLDFVLVFFFCRGLVNILEAKNPRLLIRREALFFLPAVVLVAVILFQTKYQQIILRNSIPQVTILIIFILMVISIRNTFFQKLLLPLIFLLTFFDQSRVFWRYNTFAPQAYIFPETATIKFLKKEQANGFFRIASLNPEIMPPNFAAYYKIADIGGYDPLYYEAYAQMFAAGKKPNFNRILQLDQVNENLFAILKVKYVLTFNDLPASDFKLVMQEGKTKTYENLNYHSQL